MNKRYYAPSMAMALAVAAVAHAAPPTPNSVAAATDTAEQNRLCVNVEPFYWEIGDVTGALASGSVGTNTEGHPILATTKMNTASSGKWLYGAYIVQIRGSAANLTAQDVNFLHMTSGYTNMGRNGDPEGTCPSSDSPDTVNVCLSLLNPANDLPYSYQDPAAIGFFDYDGGHIENHASLYGGIGDTPNPALGPLISGQLGTGVSFTYSEPLIPGAIFTTPSTFALVLRNIISGSLFMHDALGIDPVCTQASATCDALNSPIPEAWHYSITHWVEDDPTTNGDGAFSSPGGQGFYPWIEASKSYYGLVARAVSGGAADRAGYNSAQCGRLIRHAWDTGVQQRGRIPKDRSAEILPN